MRKVILIITVLVIVILISSCEQTNKSPNVSVTTTISTSVSSTTSSGNIVSMKFERYVYGTLVTEYMVDIKTKKAYFFGITVSGPKRNKNLNNQGYQKVYELTTVKLDKFLGKLKTYNVDNWKEEYINPDTTSISYSTQYKIFINYDNRKKEVFLNGSAPENYSNVLEALKDLTGQEF